MAYGEWTSDLAGEKCAQRAGPTFYEKSVEMNYEYTKIIFQSHSTNLYMYNQEIKTWMQQNKLEDIPLMNNIYGRDFTMNSIIYSIYHENFYDPINRAIHDFERRTVCSVLPANLLIKYSPISALKAIQSALIYDFHIDSELRIAIKTDGYNNLLKSLSEDIIVKEIVDILKINAEKGLEMLKNLGLERILRSEGIKRYLQKGEKSCAQT